jgi:hypothetical protein
MQEDAKDGSSWMYDLTIIDPVYVENVRHFVEEAMRHANRRKNSDIFLFLC